MCFAFEKGPIVLISAIVHFIYQHIPPEDRGGSPCPKFYFFCKLKPYGKFRNPTITPCGRKVRAGEEEQREKNAVNSGHLVP